MSYKRGEIKLEHVGFHYGKGSGVIDDLSLTIKPGEKLGLIGPSGAGKSTLVSLILRFFDVEKGRILFDGQDVRDVTQDSLRSAFSMVQQDTSLFHRSVFENIAYGRPGATMDEVIAAARKARAHEFITGLFRWQGASRL